MRTQTFSPPLQALYRVFVLPTLTPTTASRPLQQCIKPTRSCRGQLQSSSSIRAFSTSPQLSATRQPEKRTQLWDEEIRARHITVVDPETKSLLPPRPLRQALASIDRKTHRLVCVSPPPKPSEDFRNWVPTCRIVSKKEQYEQDKQKQKQRVAAKKNSADNVKTLELNWAIDSNDLGHKLKRVEEFLGQGRKVEVVLAKKKGGKKANLEECESVVARIVETAEGVEGAKQLKKMEGKLGGVATLFFEGPKKVAEKVVEKEKEKEKKDVHVAEQDEAVNSSI